MKKLVVVALSVASLGLSGCTGLLVGGAVAGASAVVATVHDRRTPGTVIDDKTRKAQISQRLSDDASLKNTTHLDVNVYNGVVLVVGEAVSQSVADRVLAIVRAVPNIKRVQADIRIGQLNSFLDNANDSAITAKVKASFLSLKLRQFDPSLVSVETARGNVYLMGLVTRREAHALVEKARIVRGVRSVVEVFEIVDER